MDRGLGRAFEASGGRADMGRVTGAEQSHGRSEVGLDRARAASAPRGMPDHPGGVQSGHVPAHDLRSQYRTALATNPRLTFGQFVAATRLAHNLGRRDPRITRDAILAGLAQGQSIGQTLQGLGLSSRQAQAAVKQAHGASVQSSKRT